MGSRAEGWAVVWAERVGQAGPMVWDAVFGAEMHSSCQSTWFLRGGGKGGDMRAQERN